MSTYPLAATNSSRLKPFPFGKGTELSFHERCFRRCECKGYFVEAREESSRTIWLCRDCKKPRLAQRRKSDQELIAELLGNPDLKGWDKLFCQTLAGAQKLASWQKEKLGGIAQKLGIGLECNCAIAEEGGES